MKALIVEDNFLHSKIIEKIISPHGNCDFADDGCKALELFKKAIQRKQHYDLISMDIMMPNVNGFEAIDQIRQIEDEEGIKDENRVKMIIVSAIPEPKSEQHIYNNKNTVFLQKPFSKADLLKKINDFGLT